MIGVKYAEQVEQDRLVHEASWKAQETKMREAYALDLQEKARMARMQAYRAQFQGPLIVEQEEAFYRKEGKKLEKAIIESRQKRIARARQRYSDDMEAREAEEEDRLQRIEDEKRENERIMRQNQEKIRLQEEADIIEEKRIFEVRRRSVCFLIKGPEGVLFTQK